MYDRKKGKVKLIDFNWAGRYDPGIRDQGDIVPGDVQRQIDEFAAKAKATPRRSGDQGGGDGDPAPVIEGYAHYPYNINSAIEWHTDAGPMKPIRPEHDWFMFGKLW